MEGRERFLSGMRRRSAVRATFPRTEEVYTALFTAKLALFAKLRRRLLVLLYSKTSAFC